MSRFDAIKTDRRRPSGPAKPADTAPLGAVGGRTKARVGKKALTGYFSPELSLAINMLALEQDQTIQALLGEAVDDLMRKYGKHPFGER
jgi:hypothetical protein